MGGRTANGKINLTARVKGPARTCNSSPCLWRAERCASESEHEVPRRDHIVGTVKIP
jgi:hypothetical protein